MIFINNEINNISLLKLLIYIYFINMFFFLLSKSKYIIFCFQRFIFFTV